MKKIVMFGTGGLAKFLERHTLPDTQIVAFVDTYVENSGEELEKWLNIPIYSFDARWETEVNFDYVVIAFADVDKGMEQLRKKGIKKEKIVAYGGFNQKSHNKGNYLKALESEYNLAKIPMLFHLNIPYPNICNMNIPNSSIVESDFVREQTLYLLSEQIKRKSIEGNLAEVGVFKGNFARKINKLFPDRILYLYDTFEGFDSRDFQDKDELTHEKIHAFDDTSMRFVYSRMFNKDVVNIKKGYFPDTFEEEKQKFALVSLDVDLYEPTKAGLEIFYPRLSVGGYIMIHDYNTFVYAGCQKAVEEFCRKEKISCVPIPDIAGTVIITK